MTRKTGRTTEQVNRVLKTAIAEPNSINFFICHTQAFADSLCKQHLRNVSGVEMIIKRTRNSWRFNNGSTVYFISYDRANDVAWMDLVKFGYRTCHQVLDHHMLDIIKQEFMEKYNAG